VRFVDRDGELRFLESKYYEKGFGFIVVYGRRRVGKTELLRQFFEDKPHIYFLARKTTEEDNLDSFRRRVADFFHDSSIAEAKVGWDFLFKYIGEHAKGKVVVVIDEFPYLIETCKGITSILQSAIDEYLRNREVFLILCGSSIGMMENEVLGYRSPLYGRRTGQWRLKPLNFRHLRLFFPRLSFEGLVEFYAVLGGIPLYLNLFSDEESVFDNIKEKVLRKGELLYEEVEFLLREELREPRYYMLILRAISSGRSKFGDISTATGLRKEKLTSYLSTLQDLDIVERRVPVTENPLKSRRGLYRIKDNFINFWFRYVYPNRSDLEEGRVEEVLERIREDFNSYIGRFVFEEVCRQILIDLNAAGMLPFPFRRIGGWWYRDEEIDLIALDNKGNALFVECKWRDRKVDADTYHSLKRKSETAVKDGRRYYMIIAKSGFTDAMKDIAGDEKVILHDLGSLNTAHVEAISRIQAKQ